MSRKMWGLTALLLLTAVSGCGLRDRPLLGRFRARAQTPDCQDYARNGNGYGAPVGGAYFGVPSALPCSMPSNEGYPMTTVPGGIIQPGTPEMMMPQPLPGNAVPPLQTLPPGTTPPGSAAPKPADPSADPTSLRKGTGLATSKPAGNP